MFKAILFDVDGTLLDAKDFTLSDFADLVKLID